MCCPEAWTWRDLPLASGSLANSCFSLVNLEKGRSSFSIDNHRKHTGTHTPDPQLQGSYPISTPQVGCRSNSKTVILSLLAFQQGRGALGEVEGGVIMPQRPSRIELTLTVSIHFDPTNSTPRKRNSCSMIYNHRAQKLPKGSTLGDWFHKFRLKTHTSLQMLPDTFTCKM